MMQRNNLGQEQYEFVRKLLQCGHAYAKLESYESAFREANARSSQAQDDTEQDGWYKVCVVVNELGTLIFGREWELAKGAIYSAYAKEA